MIISLLLLVGGVVMLSFGADWIVRGGSRMSRKLGVSSVIVGLTVVSYGTSFPEFLVSTISSAKGHTELALGNVVGSNICNIGLVLAISALVRPLGVSRNTVRQDMPAMAVVSLMLCLMSVDGVIGQVDGTILALGTVLYTVWHVMNARRQYMRASSLPGFEEESKKQGRTWVNVGLMLLGGVSLWLGSEGVIRGAVDLSMRLSLDMRFVGLTIVALGTSLPELVTSIVAAAKGEEGISLGNVIGSNIFNITFVLGIAALVNPIPVALDAAMAVDMGVMLLIAVTLWPILHVQHRVSRPSGILFLAMYAAYVGYRAWGLYSG